MHVEKRRQKQHRARNLSLKSQMFFYPKLKMPKDGISLWIFFATISSFRVSISTTSGSCFFLTIWHTDLTTRSGLRKVHANFNSIYSKLHRTYEHSESYYKVKGGIVGIAARMCVDSLLRNKLFDKGTAPCVVFPILCLDFTHCIKASWTRSCRYYT